VKFLSKKRIKEMGDFLFFCQVFTKGRKVRELFLSNFLISKIKLTNKHPKLTYKEYNKGEKWVFIN
jgi:hypothetical protein